MRRPGRRTTGRRVLRIAVLALLALLACGALLRGPAISFDRAGSPTELYARWQPPRNMPRQGSVELLTGARRIPSTAGFAPRDASLYLPPAARVPNPPALPLIVFMMGQPGDPDPGPLRTALDELAAQHRGLAPIALVVDQLGSPDDNPACVDSAAYGGVQTYVTRDVVEWARTNLHVERSPAFWTIGGFSNGGGCALDWGLERPGLWGAIVSISGESYQGTEFPDRVLQQVFDGDAAAYAAAKPAAQVAHYPGAYSGHVALFAAGSQDEFFTAQVDLSADLTRQAGLATTVFSIPGQDHVGALPEGLRETLGALYPHLGLAPPPRR